MEIFINTAKILLTFGLCMLSKKLCDKQLSTENEKVCFLPHLSRIMNKIKPIIVVYYVDCWYKHVHTSMPFGTSKLVEQTQLSISKHLNCNANKIYYLNNLKCYIFGSFGQNYFLFDRRLNNLSLPKGLKLLCERKNLTYVRLCRSCEGTYDRPPRIVSSYTRVTDTISLLTLDLLPILPSHMNLFNELITFFKEIIKIKY
ncbi:hypothetical protein AGLY_009163 [Aphis glycines]|uniref:Uncharacterized protein n=1 Tax=Aphis glycines TaxID=307491 RepID=A0A6G0TIX5_APHGL|nr:hypothetical protein AGLY_009163 [Aphis glycines]